MSWPVGGAAAVVMAALVIGCTQPPARQSAGQAARAPLKLPPQTATLPRPQVLLASAPAVSDHDRDRWRVDVPAPAPARPPVTRAVRTAALPPGVGLVPGVGVSSVRYTPPPTTRPRPAGMLSITQVGLDPAATTRDSTTDAVDALEQRLAQGTRQRGVVVPVARGLVYPSDALAAVFGAGRSRVSDSTGFGGVEFLPPIRFSWTTGSPYALGEMGLER